MRNQLEDTKANSRDRFFGMLRYGVYLIAEPFSHLLRDYPSYNSPVYELDNSYFINLAVQRRLSRKSGEKKSDL